MVSFLNYDFLFSSYFGDKPRPETLQPSLLKIAKVNWCAGSQTPSVSHVKHLSLISWSVIARSEKDSSPVNHQTNMHVCLHKPNHTSHSPVCEHSSIQQAPLFNVPSPHPDPDFSSYGYFFTPVWWVTLGVFWNSKFRLMSWQRLIGL
jgi:hypothetical protein